jgi:hypothetical protein
MEAPCGDASIHTRLNKANGLGLLFIHSGVFLLLFLGGHGGEKERLVWRTMDMKEAGGALRLHEGGDHPRWLVVDVRLKVLAGSNSTS